MLTPSQILKASSTLLLAIEKSSKEKSLKSGKKNVLDEATGASTALSETPIWLIITTKRYIKDSHGLKPHKLVLPHPLDLSAQSSDSTISAASPPPSTICLITADPQRAYKNIVASPSFPADLRSRVTRVIGVEKLRAKYNQYEAQRQLLSEHDVFLADERIISRLPKLLGKTFYRSTTKRPVPVLLAAPRPRDPSDPRKRLPAPPKKKGAEKVEERPTNAGSPEQIAAEIRKALGAALVNLAPSASTAVRVAWAGWPAEHVAENVRAAAEAIVDKWVPQGWDNVRAVYIKGPETISLPVWQTSELWLGEGDVIPDGDEKEQQVGKKKKKDKVANGERKRKSLDMPAESEVQEDEQPKKKKVKKALPESNDDALDRQIAERKAALKKQKAAAKKTVEV